MSLSFSIVAASSDPSFVTFTPTCAHAHHITALLLSLSSFRSF